MTTNGPDQGPSSTPQPTSPADIDAISRTPGGLQALKVVARTQAMTVGEQIAAVRVWHLLAGGPQSEPFRAATSAIKDTLPPATLEALTRVYRAAKSEDVQKATDELEVVWTVAYWAAASELAAHAIVPPAPQVTAEVRDLFDATVAPYLDQRATTPERTLLWVAQHVGDVNDDAFGADQAEHLTDAQAARVARWLRALAGEHWALPPDAPRAHASYPGPMPPIRVVDVEGDGWQVLVNHVFTVSARDRAGALDAGVAALRRIARHGVDAAGPDLRMANLVRYVSGLADEQVRVWLEDLAGHQERVAELSKRRARLDDSPG